jgi:hypothetical protein
MMPVKTQERLREEYISGPSSTFPNVIFECAFIEDIDDPHCRIVQGGKAIATYEKRLCEQPPDLCDEYFVCRQ